MLTLFLPASESNPLPNLWGFSILNCFLLQEFFKSKSSLMLESDNFYDIAINLVFCERHYACTTAFFNTFLLGGANSQRRDFTGGQTLKRGRDTRTKSLI